MAIAFVSAGTAAVGTTSLAVPHPGSIAAGNMLILAIANKYPTNGPATPSGWTAATNYRQSGSSGANGIDTGAVYISVYWKIAVGNETGNLTVTITSGNSAVGRMFQYSKASNKNWGLAMVNGSDNTAGTAWSVTGGANPGITAGDMVLMCSGINTDGYTYSAQAVSATGISAWGTVTERQDSGTTQGQDCGLVVSEHPVTTGTASAAPVFTMTASGSATNAPAGASVFVRLRELNQYTLAMDAGTGTITGQVLNFKRALKLIMAQGSGTITGQALALKAARRFTLATGSGTITGRDVTFRKGYNFVLGSGTGTIQGNNLNFTRALKVTLEPGAGTIQGQAAGLIKNSRLLMGSGNITLAGYPVTFKRSLRVVLDTGTGTITGQVVGLVFNPAPGSTYTMVLGSGAGTITGNQVQLKAARKFTLEAGTGQIQGVAVGIRAARKLIMAAGVGTIAGQDVILVYQVPGTAEYKLWDGIQWVPVEIFYWDGAAWKLPAKIDVFTAQGWQ